MVIQILNLQCWPSHLINVITLNYHEWLVVRLRVNLGNLRIREQRQNLEKRVPLGKLRPRSWHQPVGGVRMG